MLRLDQLMLYCLVITGLIQLVASEHNTIMALQPKYMVRKRNIDSFHNELLVSRSTKDNINTLFARNDNTEVEKSSESQSTVPTGNDSSKQSVDSTVAALEGILAGVDPVNETIYQNYNEIHKPFNVECLDAANSFRKAENQPNLILNNTLIRGAQTWAEHLVYMNSKGSIDLLNSQIGFGENLFSAVMPKDSSFTCNDVMKSWYSQKPAQAEQNKAFGDVKSSNSEVENNESNYNQLMSPITKSQACGYATYGHKDEKLVFVVCEYYPPGN